MMAAAINNVLHSLRLRRRPTQSHRSRADVMASAPVRNSLVEWRTEDTGEVSLIIPADHKQTLRFLVKVMNLPAKRVVALDAVGSFVWEQCDGERTFGEVSEALAKQFGMTRRESEASLAEFFRVLGKRGMLGFVVADGVKDQIEAAKSKGRGPGKRQNRKKGRR